MSRVLVVDSDSQQARLLDKMLGALGHDAIILPDREDAFDYLSEKKCDVLLLAINNQAIELLSQLCCHPHSREIPVIVLLAAPKEDLIAACLQAGAVDYLSTPILPLVLQARVTAAVRSEFVIDLLEQQNKDLAQANYLLEGQRSQMELTLQQLHNTRDEQIERAKMVALADLVVGVAHEINTPLGNTLTTISHLQECSREAEHAFHAGKLKRSQLNLFLGTCMRGHEVMLRSLERTVDLMESFKRVSVDPSCEELRSVHLKPYIQEVVSSYKGKLKDQGHTVKVQGPQDLVFNSYPRLLAQIFGHLLSNSITHGYPMEKHGKLSFVFSQSDSGVQIHYSDDGQGIPEQHLSRVFDPFFTTLRGGGSGLGLHITYNLVTHVLQGKIRCWSEAKKGSTFLIDIPWLEST